jgi:para-aminobenzoate synthetase component 1
MEDISARILKKISWQNPLNFAEKIANNYSKNWVFLYSGLNSEIKNSISYIALFPEKTIIADHFSKLENAVKNSSKKWFGYISYEASQDFEKTIKTKKSFINLPKIYLMNFQIIFEFHHHKKLLKVFYKDKNILDEVLNYKAKATIPTKIKITNFDSNFSDDSYLKTIEKIKKMIADGDFYQANLTRKFFGEFKNNRNHQNNFQLFLELAKSSSANYSSFLKLDNNYIISSSPELFLNIKNNNIISRPIKGTAPRDDNKIKDQKNKINLKNSIKERAENLMIVDLVRNDLARVCKAGSVKVKNLFKINSYANVHHMSSEIHGKIAGGFNALNAIKSTFPAGSMTGAPKIKAMEVIAKEEKLDRGIYSGAIGYLSGSEANLSVVIRTLIIADKKFEFQVGGAITFDSEPEAELKEIFAKAKSIGKMLGADLGH